MTEQLSDDPEQNYARFIDEAINCGCIWGLEGPDGWALCPSEKYDTSEVMPFWSQPEFAELHCRDEWQNYNVIPVALTEFLDDWLPGMHDDVFLRGVGMILRLVRTAVGSWLMVNG